MKHMRFGVVLIVTILNIYDLFFGLLLLSVMR